MGLQGCDPAVRLHLPRDVRVLGDVSSRRWKEAHSGWHVEAVGTVDMFSSSRGRAVPAHVSAGLAREQLKQAKTRERRVRFSCLPPCAQLRTLQP